MKGERGMSREQRDRRPDGGVRRSFLRDTWLIVASNVVGLVASFLSGILIARILGPEGRGLLAALLVVPTILVSLAELGIRQAATYLIGSRSYAAQRLVSSVIGLLIVTSAGGVLIAAASYRSMGNEHFTWTMVALALAIVPLRLATSYMGGVLLGREDIGAFARLKRVPELIRLLVVASLVLAGALSVSGAIAATVLGNAVVAVWALRIASREFSLRPAFDWTINRELVRLGVVYAVTLFVMQLNLRVDVLLLERLATPRELGYYSLGASLAEQLWQLPTALGVVIFSRRANSGRREEFSLQVARMLRVSTAAIAVGAVLLLLLADILVPALYGSAFSPSATVIRLLLPGIIAFALVKVMHTDLAGYGTPGVCLYAAVPAVVLNVLLNLWLIPQHGAAGAAFASTISYGTAAGLLVPLYARRVGVPITALVGVRRDDLSAVLERLGRRRRPAPAVAVGPEDRGMTREIAGRAGAHGRLS